MVQHLFRSLCTAWPRWFHQFTLSYTNYSPWKCLPTVNVQGLRLTVSLREGVTTIASFDPGQSRSQRGLWRCFTGLTNGDLAWKIAVELVKKFQWHQTIIRWLCSLNIRFFGDMTFSFKDFLGWLFCWIIWYVTWCHLTVNSCKWIMRKHANFFWCGSGTSRSQHTMEMDTLITGHEQVTEQIPTLKEIIL